MQIGQHRGEEKMAVKKQINLLHVMEMHYVLILKDCLFKIISV